MNDALSELFLADPDPAPWKIALFYFWFFLTLTIVLHWAWMAFHKNPQRIRQTITIKIDRLLEDLDYTVEDLQSEYHSEVQEGVNDLNKKGTLQSGYQFTLKENAVRKLVKGWKKQIRETRRKTDDILIVRGFEPLISSRRFEKYDKLLGSKQDEIKSFVKSVISSLQETGRQMNHPYEPPEDLKQLAN